MLFLEMFWHLQEQDKTLWVFSTQHRMLYGGCASTLSGIPSMQSEETLFWMGVMCEPMNVCKYCICTWKKTWNILLMMSEIVKYF